MSEALRDAFRKTVRDAKTSLEHFAAAPESYYTSLWQVIAGPPHSGKTYAAQEYANDLAEAGLTTAPLRFIDSATRQDNFSRLFRDAKNGTIIIDDPAHLDTRAAKALYEEITKAFDQQSCVIVLTGYRSSVDPFLENMPPELKIRWSPEVRETSHVFTREESEAFDARNRAVRDAAAKAVAAENARKTARLAEIEKWKKLPEVDISAPKTLKPMRAVKFGPTPSKS